MGAGAERPALAFTALISWCDLLFFINKTQDRVFRLYFGLHGAERPALAFTALISWRALGSDALQRRLELAALISYYFFFPPQVRRRLPARACAFRGHACGGHSGEPVCLLAALSRPHPPLPVTCPYEPNSKPNFNQNGNPSIKKQPNAAHYTAVMAAALKAGAWPEAARHFQVFDLGLSLF